MVLGTGKMAAQMRISTFVLAIIKVQRKLKGTATSVTMQTTKQFVQMLPRKSTSVYKPSSVNVIFKTLIKGKEIQL